MATAWRRVNRVRVPRNPYAQPGDCVLHMAQEIGSRHKHNMLSLLYATCLKLLVFFFNIKCRLFLSDSNNKTSNLSKIFEKYSDIKITWKSMQWEPSSSVTDKRTDRRETKLVVGFRNFANASKNVLLVLKHCLQCTCLCGGTRDTNHFPTQVRFANAEPEVAWIRYDYDRIRSWGY